MATSLSRYIVPFMGFTAAAVSLTIVLLDLVGRGRLDTGGLLVGGVGLVLGVSTYRRVSHTQQK
jgi:hypothetical protein